eukprot:GHVS01058390.1.p1 GENE.GHVS01058390.1~~GHVS01058390.1.p1  ORF type:complete len:374 (+),score=27.41 GHVS01058390.1:720-1841(+)
MNSVSQSDDVSTDKLSRDTISPIPSTCCSSPMDARVEKSMSGKKYLIDFQRKIVCRDGTVVLLRSMNASDYETVRTLLPGVSTCSSFHESKALDSILQLPLYHPFCAFQEDSGEFVGFGELYRLPHLGRKFDCRLERVLTIESFRGKGLATALCQNLILLAKDQLSCGRIDLTVEKSDARHIYEKKLGFKKVATSLLRLKFDENVAEVIVVPISGKVPEIETQTMKCKDGINVCVSPMLKQDYDAVRRMLPTVSRCHLELSVETLESVLEDPLYFPFCAFRQDTRELVGFAELYRLPHLGRNFDGRLERVLTVESFRGNGLASGLCEHLVKLARENLNCGRVDLTVENNDARHIYEDKLGFKPVTTTTMRLEF